MSLWARMWREFVRDTSYMHVLKEEGISNDEFWNAYGSYDDLLRYSGYPGEILKRVSSFIPPGATFLDIGAGTGAFAVPISRKTKKTIAIDPSPHQISALLKNARAEGLKNITTLIKPWSDVEMEELVGPEGRDGIDYSLAAYSLFDEEIERFLQKMIDVSRRGTFIVFRAGETDPLAEFAYGKRRFADHTCLCHILSDMGYQFNVEIFRRDYLLPVCFVLKQYRFSKKTPDELLERLEDSGRIINRDDSSFASFSNKDALLYLTN